MVEKMTDEQQEFLNAKGKVVIKACPGRWEDSYCCA